MPEHGAEQDDARALANLRHAYHQLMEGRVSHRSSDQQSFAKGLVGPAIVVLERAQAARATSLIASREVVGTPGSAVSVTRLVLTPEGQAALQVHPKPHPGASAG